MSGDGQVHLHRDGPVATLVFDRPATRNAMTWSMYEALGAHCRAFADDRSVRVVLLVVMECPALSKTMDLNAQYDGRRERFSSEGFCPLHPVLCVPPVRGRIITGFGLNSPKRSS